MQRKAKELPGARVVDGASNRLTSPRAIFLLALNAGSDVTSPLPESLSFLTSCGKQRTSSDPASPETKREVSAAAAINSPPKLVTLNKHSVLLCLQPR
ncbi:hypothetical protein CEXT_235811 [Caerostris extrusa]|uniref:Uncharacterized protein n=1 Tax=Caerostris extrusa TaxID=172846 RepID=A0AAV4N5T4_CAEEX|nr:hypothetical protein CEXT_235811 [Caerostris extrusa]